MVRTCPKTGFTDPKGEKVEKMDRKVSQRLNKRIFKKGDDIVFEKKPSLMRVFSGHISFTIVTIH